MEVILIQAVPKLGYPGDTVKVKPGFARNYLFPRGYAIPATPRNRKHAEHLKLLSQRRKQKFVNNLKELVERLKEVRLLIEERTHDGGNLYGSVQPRRVAQLLGPYSGGLTIDPRWIHMDHPLKTVGEYTIEVEPHTGLKAQIHITIRSLNEELSVPPPTPSPSVESL